MNTSFIAYEIKCRTSFLDLWVPIGLVPISPYLISFPFCLRCCCPTGLHFSFRLPKPLLSIWKLCLLFSLPGILFPWFFAWLAFYHPLSFCSNVSFSEKGTLTSQFKVNPTSTSCFTDSTHKDPWWACLFLSLLVNFYLLIQKVMAETSRALITTHYPMHLALCLEQSNQS